MTIENLLHLLRREERFLTFFFLIDGLEFDDLFSFGRLLCFIVLSRVVVSRSLLLIWGSKVQFVRIALIALEHICIRLFEVLVYKAQRAVSSDN